MGRNRTDDANHPRGGVSCPECARLDNTFKDPLEIWSRRTLFLTAIVLSAIFVIAFSIAFEPLPANAPFVYSL